MRSLIEKNLLQFAKERSTVLLDELEQLAPKVNSYEKFAALIVNLENDNILDMVKSQGRNQRTPSIAYKYRINRHGLNRTYHQELQTYRLKFHHAINLDAYFNLDFATWTSDLPYLEKINTYIEANGLPTEKVPAPERSFELVGNEKWIEEKGTDILQRIKLCYLFLQKRCFQR